MESVLLSCPREWVSADHRANREVPGFGAEAEDRRVGKSRLEPYWGFMGKMW
jgi:hypothetical protein